LLLLEITGGKDQKAWTKAHNSIQMALVMLDKKRPQLEPVFNPEDSTEFAILKGERGEILIESLREELIGLANATSFENARCTFDRQKGALLALSRIGELLVKVFPYDVPSKGKFSYLPRLLGRATVTFKIKRAGATFGNITIIADGYTAPITAGNFVDLCIRNFYTGLPVESFTKRFGSGMEQYPAQVNVLGSYNDGFFDPITAKLRTLPLEIIRLEGGSGRPKLSYSSAGLSGTSLSDMLGNYQAVEPSQNGKPLLTFDTPGLVAMNHPDRAPNSGSSAFFSLQSDTLPQDRRKVLDGEYAPFGFIIDGTDIYEELQPGDVIDSTLVDEFGALNLVKIRKSSLKEAASATGS
jgi:peptidylprolyl isomerase